MLGLFLSVVASTQSVEIRFLVGRLVLFCASVVLLALISLAAHYLSLLTIVTLFLPLLHSDRASFFPFFPFPRIPCALPARHLKSPLNHESSPPSPAVLLKPSRELQAGGPHALHRNLLATVGGCGRCSSTTGKSAISIEFFA